MAAAFAPPSSSSSSAANPHRGTSHRAPAATAHAGNAPHGTFLPGTKVQVGSHRVVIEKYLSEGGFAHVYVVRVPKDGGGRDTTAVLKRVAVPDKEHLANMRTEVETMKKLKGHDRIVTYFDSHASQLAGGGYEVFLLMEFCQGGGLIDFMNTRLQHRLQEPEILKIFADVAEGVACMHYLKPPLLHRDLKVENVLISKPGRDGVPVYKLCDFGSTAPPRPAATTAEEGRLIEEDVQQHTTMQYRSPEMIDVWRKRPIDEKADIWALGVLLYKLCYYTTPFEEVGQMAILNASFKYPSYPPFSDRLKALIGRMLKEDPRDRPNIYQLVKDVCGMRGVDVPIKDIYANRTQSEGRRNETLPSATPDAASPSPRAIGLQKAAPRVEVQTIPDIAPMRRGRPGQPANKSIIAGAKPSPSPARGDPFAALDSKNFDVRAGAVDELAKRFPSLDEFSIAHEQSGPFQFGNSASSAAASPLAVASPPAAATPLTTAKSRLSERVTNALADEVFATTKPQPDLPKSQSATQLQRQSGASMAKSQVGGQRSREQMGHQSIGEEPAPGRAGWDDGKYRSTAVGSSPPDKPPRPTKSAQLEVKPPAVSRQPVWRVPSDRDRDRSKSQPRASDTAQAAAASLQPSAPPAQRPALLDVHRSKSQTATLIGADGPRKQQPPSTLDPDSVPAGAGDDTPLTRARSAQNRPRPSSAYVSSNLDFLRDHESSRKSSGELRRGPDTRRHSRQPSPRIAPVGEGDADEIEDADDDHAYPALEDRNIENEMDFLHSREEDAAGDPKRRLSRKSSSGPGSGHRKRSSLPSISATTKEIFRGRFGDAFKRFEGSGSASASASGSGSASKDDSDRAVARAEPEPEPRASIFGTRDDDGGDGRGGGSNDDIDRALLSPIAGSETTLGKHSRGDGTESPLAEELPVDLPPDVRRELERRRLSQEERRVAEAARLYRGRVTGDGTGGLTSQQQNMSQQHMSQQQQQQQQRQQQQQQQHHHHQNAASRASTIQRRVQSLLDEGARSTSPVKRTAEGYGRFTDVGSPPGEARELTQTPVQMQTQMGTQAQAGLPPRTSSLTKPGSEPAAIPATAQGRFPSGVTSLSDQVSQGPAHHRTRPSPALTSPGVPSTGAPSATYPPAGATAPVITSPPLPPLSSSIPPVAAQPQQPQRIVSRPSAPPKPKVLRTGQWPPSPVLASERAAAPEKALPPLPRQGGLAALLARDLEGVPDYPTREEGDRAVFGGRSGVTAGNGAGGSHSGDAAAVDAEEAEREFSRRYPSLSGIEMVETDIGGRREPERTGAMRMREI